MMARTGLRVDARLALRRVSGRVGALLDSIPDLEMPSALPGWSVADVGVHLMTVFRAFADATAGGPDWWSRVIPDEPEFRARLVAVNEAGIRVMRGQVTPGDRVGELVARAAEDFLNRTEDLAPDAEFDTPWYGPGARRPVSFAPALLLGEAICHGLDIARAAGRPWPIEPADARVVVERVLPLMMPAMADRAAIAGVDVDYEVRLRGGGAWTIAIHDGDVQMLPGGAEVAPDCYVSAAPVGMMLVGYGRLPMGRALLTGQISAYGRRPWTALRLKSYFSDP
jgi:uncharacterized protein (TIGR03083 family)